MLCIATVCSMCLLQYELCMQAHVVPSAIVPSQTPITTAMWLPGMLYCRPEVRWKLCPRSISSYRWSQVLCAQHRVNQGPPAVAQQKGRAKLKVLVCCICSHAEWFCSEGLKWRLVMLQNHMRVGRFCHNHYDRSSLPVVICEQNCSMSLRYTRCWTWQCWYISLLCMHDVEVANAERKSDYPKSTDQKHQQAQHRGLNWLYSNLIAGETSTMFESYPSS